jgi:hypothetical protein
MLCLRHVGKRTRTLVQTVSQLGGQIRGGGIVNRNILKIRSPVSASARAFVPSRNLCCDSRLTLNDNPTRYIA